MSTFVRVYRAVSLRRRPVRPHQPPRILAAEQALRWHSPVVLALTITMLAGAGAVAPGSTGDQQQVSGQLQTLRSRMAQLRAELDASRDQRDTVRAELEGVEQGIAEIAGRLQDLDRQLGQAQQRLEALEADRHTLLDQVAGQRQVLSRQLRAAYMLGRQEYAKLLLNQEDPAAMGRVLTYYDYFQRARVQQIARLNGLLQRLQDVHHSVQAEADRVSALRAEEATKQAELAEHGREREALLARLSQEIETKDQSLARMQADERALEQVLKTLRELLTDIPKQGDRRPFERLKGKLHWPVKGKVMYAFGAPRQGGKLRSQGVLLAAQEGTPVHAVYHGRVAFADWLRGFGLLLIIDHGDGYMSLYGHNQSLETRTGDWVEADDVVARVGASGGQPQAGLYFEIRHKGEPTDPTRWCSTK